MSFVFKQSSTKPALSQLPNATLGSSHTLCSPTGIHFKRVPFHRPSPARRVLPHCSAEPGSPGDSPTATGQKRLASNSQEEQSNWDPKKQER